MALPLPTFTVNQVVTKADLDMITAAILEVQTALLVSAWAAITYATSWRTLAGTAEPLAERHSGIQGWLQGIVEYAPSGTPAIIPLGSTIGTLPVAARPAAMFRGFGDRAASNNNDQRHRVDILTNGNIQSAVSETGGVTPLTHVLNLNAMTWSIG